MFQRLIVTFIDREPAPFADRLQQIGLIDRVLDVDSWWTLNGTVIVTVHEDNEDVIDDLLELPFVKSVHYDEIVTQTAVIMEPINIAASKRQQVTSGLIKYMSYYREGLRERINVPWTDNGFDYAVPVETQRDGTGIYVCIMDSGIEPTNSEFTDRTIIALPRRGLNSIGPHGTACAQHVGGNTLGFATGCTFIDANCFGDSPSTSTSNIVASMGDLADYVATNLTNGEMVVCNMSFGGSTAGVYGDPVDNMQALGIICFTSSGNGATSTDGDVYPARNLKYGAVGAVDYNLQRSWFSNWGSNVFCHQIGQWIPFKGRWDNPADDSVVLLISGTSFSCPFTVGCFVTWVAGKKAPSSKAGCEFMQKQFLRAQGLYGYIKDQYGRLNIEQAAFMLADNSPITSSLIVDSGAFETTLVYGEIENGIGLRQMEVALTYGGTMTDILLTNNAQIIGGVHDTTVGHFPSDYATHCIRFPFGTGTQIVLPNAENEIWVSFYIRTGTPTNNLGERPCLFLSSDNFNFPAIGLYARGSALEWFQQTNGSSSSDTTWSKNTTALAVNTMTRMDIFIRFEEVSDSLNSTVQFYLNGVLSFELNNAARYTTNPGPGYKKILYLGNPGDSVPAFTDFFSISNLRISTTDTRGKNFLSLPLNTVGTYNQFDLDGFAALNDQTNRLIARSQTAGQRVSGTLDFASIPDNGAISEVKLSSVFSVDSVSANPNALAHFVRDGTTNYDQSLLSPVNFRDVLLTSLTNNPATASEWTLADLNGMQFGLLSGNI